MLHPLQPRDYDVRLERERKRYQWARAEQRLWMVLPAFTIVVIAVVLCDLYLAG